MTRFTVAREGTIVGVEGHPLAPAKLETLLDEVLDALLALNGITDQDLSATLAAGLVRIALDVETTDLLEAARLGDGAIRTALHAASIATPAWETPALDRIPQPREHRAEFEGGSLSVQPQPQLA